MAKRVIGRLHYLVITLLLVILLSTCSDNNQTTYETIETQTLTPTNLTLPSLEPTSTKTPLPTPTVPTPEPVLSQCVSMLAELPDIDDFDGKIVVQTRYAEGYNYIFGPNEEPEIILDAFPGTTVISPDYSKIAYLDYSARLLTVSDIEGNVLKRFWTDPINPGKDQNLFPVQWLDDQHILMFARGRGEYPNYLAPYAAIFDLELGRSEKIQMDFPGISLEYHQVGFMWHLAYAAGDSRLAISPDMDIILYPTLDGIDGFLVIWDRGIQEEISRFSGIMPWHTVPRWSHTGDYFAFMANQNSNGDELFVLDQSGNYQKITTFETNNPGDISWLSWSPDGHRIAFWMDLFDAEDRHSFGGSLFIVDLRKNVVNNYCIDGQGEIYWSKDGKYLFISTFLEGGRGDEFNITVINLEELWAADLIEYAEVYGVLYEEEVDTN